MATKTKVAHAVSPVALSIDAAAELFTKAGGRKVDAAAIAADVAAGAPTNRDGTIHLVHYAAWLACQVDWPRS